MAYSARGAARALYCSLIECLGMRKRMCLCDLQMDPTLMLRLIELRLSRCQAFLHMSFASTAGDCLFPSFDSVDYNSLSLLLISNTIYDLSILPSSQTQLSPTFHTMVRHKKDNLSKRSPRHLHRPGHDTDPESPNPRPPFRAACWDLEHCDPKRCSGKRLVRFNMMRELSVGQKFAGVVISPNAKRLISPLDKELIEQFGAAVVECSWMRIKEVPWSKIGGKCERLCGLTLTREQAGDRI